MEPAAVVVVLTTLPADADAAAFARTLVDERLAACVSVYGVMQSVYRWQGRIAVDDERQVVIKTTADRVAGLQSRLAGWHPYEVPEFLVLPAAGGGDAYLAWVRESASP